MLLKLKQYDFYFRMAEEVINVTAQPMSEPVHNISKAIFLQTTTAQVVSGIFVWAALFITCQQVSAFYELCCFFSLTWFYINFYFV